MTQPALTRSITALENRVGARLFERSRRGTQPTAAGLALYSYAITIVNDCRRAAEEIAAIGSGGAGKVTIGVGASYVSCVMEEVISRAAEELPSVEFEVVEGLIEDLIEPLIHGRIDVILTTITAASARAKLILEPLMSVAPMVVAGAKHPLARGKAPHVSELARADWVSVDQTYTLDVLARMFSAQHLPCPQPLRSSSTDLVKSLVMTGQFLALLPERAVAKELARGQIRRINIPIPVLPVEGGLIYLDRPVRSAAIDRVIHLVREVCSST